MRIQWPRSVAASIAKQPYDFSRLRVALQLRLLEHRLPIAHDLEAAAARRNQLDLRLGKLVSNLGRQTDGPRFVVSNRAVLDRDLHGGSGECRSARE
jgi:hypothetical protein